MKFKYKIPIETAIRSFKVENLPNRIKFMVSMKTVLIKGKQQSVEFVIIWRRTPILVSFL